MTLPENTGFIRDNLDIKILILYVLDMLPSPVDNYVLYDLVQIDRGFTWFEYSDCLADLVTSGQVDQDEKGRYEITEMGHTSVGYVGSSLPYSVRAKADRHTGPVAAALRRARQIETFTDKTDDGHTYVSLRLSDGVGEVIAMRISMPDNETAAAVEENFRKNAEDITNRIIELLV